MSRTVDWSKCLDELELQMSQMKIGEKDRFSRVDASVPQGPTEEPTSQIYSVKTFDALPLKPNLLKGVYDMGFNAPSRIQEIVLPTLLMDPPQNAIVQSPPGTGKTAALVLTMLARVNHKKRYPQVLCLCPTFELALLTGEVAALIAKFCVEIELLYALPGGKVPDKITEHVIIGTIRTVCDWGLRLRLFDLNEISVIALDEADVMIGHKKGKQERCVQILKSLNKNCQMMFFSATYDKQIMNFAESMISNPLMIRPKVDNTFDNIKQYYIRCNDQDEKYDVVVKIYNTAGIGQVMVFCNTNDTADWLAVKMSLEGYTVAILTANLTVDQRINILDRFRNRSESFLITTNVLSRGIHVELVRTVIVNFDLPVCKSGRPDWESYMHRIGRIGCSDVYGMVVNLVDSPKSMALCRVFEQQLDKVMIPINTDGIKGIVA